MLTPTREPRNYLRSKGSEIRREGLPEKQEAPWTTPTLPFSQILNHAKVTLAGKWLCSFHTPDKGWS